MSFDVILPFLRPIAHLLQDPAITEVMVNGSGRTFVERDGRLESVPGVTVREQNLRVAVRNLARVLGDDISEEQPLLDSRLPDGSRVAAALAPVSLGGTTLTIRKFQSQTFTADELVRIGTLTASELQAIRQAMEARDNILMSGGTGTGKTTLLNALAAFLPADDRLVVIEDTAELQLDASNLVRFEARREQPGLPPVTIRDLLRATLRHRPDRILVGEVRGGEAFDLLQALNTGHSGTLSTIHANSAEQALSRFTSCVLQSGVDLPYAAIRYGISECLQVLAHLERRHGRRVLTQLVRVRRYDSAADRYDLAPLISGPAVDLSGRSGAFDEGHPHAATSMENREHESDGGGVSEAGVRRRRRTPR
jgi:pilus assembly protein CpaF